MTQRVMGRKVKQSATPVTCEDSKASQGCDSVCDMAAPWYRSTADFSQAPEILEFKVAIFHRTPTPLHSSAPESSDLSCSKGTAPASGAGIPLLCSPFGSGVVFGPSATRLIRPTPDPRTSDQRAPRQPYFVPLRKACQPHPLERRSRLNRNSPSDPFGRG